MPALAIIGVVVIVALVLHSFNHRERHKERMSLIEKGVDPSLWMREESFPLRMLLWGSSITGGGFGALVGYILSLTTPLHTNAIVPILSILFGGIGIICYYIYRRRLESRGERS